MILFRCRAHACLGFLCLGVFVFNQQSARAETRLFIPQFRAGPDTDTQLLVVNSGERDATLDLWAFRQGGEYIGHPTGHGLGLQLEHIAERSSDGFQLSYTSDAGRSGAHEGRQCYQGAET